MRTFDELDLSHPGVVVGNHGVWIPGLGVKVPFQWGGKVTKFSRHEAGGSRESIVDEMEILKALAAKKMAPPVGDLVFFRNVISHYFGAWHCDPCGAYGYEIADATTLPPGEFSLEEMKKLPILGSKGAWGDVTKPDNIVNGYLIDVRRSAHDLLRWGGVKWPLPDAREVQTDLIESAHKHCQFPAYERDMAYQDFWVNHELVQGQRRVEERAKQLRFRPKAGESVLDIGTQSGSFLQYAYQAMKGDGLFAGVELSQVYVDHARAIARSCDQNICFRRMDVVQEREIFLEWVKAYFPNGVDHLLLLSMEKHLGEDFMFGLIDMIQAKNTYIETNAVSDGSMKLLDRVTARKGVHVGDSNDRNLRRLYKISQ